MTADYNANLHELVEMTHRTGAMAFKAAALEALEAAGMTNAMRVVLAVPLPARMQSPEDKSNAR